MIIALFEDIIYLILISDFYLCRRKDDKGKFQKFGIY